MSFFLFLAAMVVYAISLNQKIKTLELSIENERLLREYNDKSLEYKIKNFIFKQNNWITDPGSERIDISEQLRRLRLQNVTEEAVNFFKNLEQRQTSEK